MDDREGTPERRSHAQDGLVPATSARLHRMLADLPTPFVCRYACFIHPRRREGEQGFGIITLNGESLPLTVEMLASLRHVRTLYEGRALVIVGPAQATDQVIPSDDGAWSVPLPVTRISLRLMPDEEPEDEAPWPRGTEQIMTTAAHGPQVTLLCANRPAGWPA